MSEYGSDSVGLTLMTLTGLQGSLRKRGLTRSMHLNVFSHIVSAVHRYALIAEGKTQREAVSVSIINF